MPTGSNSLACQMSARYVYLATHGEFQADALTEERIRVKKALERPL